MSSAKCAGLALAVLASVVQAHEPVPALADSEQWVSAEALQEQAEQAVRRTWAGQFRELKVTPVASNARGMSVPAGSINLVARDFESRSTPYSRQTVWVDVRQRDTTLRSALVTLRVEALQPGWVALADLRAGTRLNATLMREELVDAARLGQAPWQGELDGKVIKSGLRAGGVLAAAQVEAAPAVTRGEQVALTHRTGELILSGQAEALQSGVVGQSIQVRVLTGKGTVLARVTGAGALELLP